MSRLNGIVLPRKFNDDDINIIIDALDQFGFEEIHYIPDENVFYVLFSGEENRRNDSNNTLVYLSTRIPDLNWKYFPNDKFGVYTLSHRSICIMTYTGFNREVCL